MFKRQKMVKTWEENMKHFDESLAIFKGNNWKPCEMRKHIMHCRHNVSFEDFVYLTAGPLEHGVYYKTTVEENRNKARNETSNETKKALQMIMAFPEFENWNKDGQSVQATTWVFKRL